MRMPPFTGVMQLCIRCPSIRTTHSWQAPMKQKGARGACLRGLIRNTVNPFARSAVATVSPAIARIGSPSTKIRTVFSSAEYCARRSIRTSILIHRLTLTAVGRGHSRQAGLENKSSSSSTLRTASISDSVRSSIGLRQYPPGRPSKFIAPLILAGLDPIFPIALIRMQRFCTATAYSTCPVPANSKREKPSAPRTCVSIAPIKTGLPIMAPKHPCLAE